MILSKLNFPSKTSKIFPPKQPATTRQLTWESQTLHLSRSSDISIAICDRTAFSSCLRIEIQPRDHFLNKHMIRDFKFIIHEQPGRIRQSELLPSALLSLNNLESIVELLF